MANSARSKGHSAERFYALIFKEAGYEKCITSRMGGKIYDDSGIDLINIPYRVQIKAGSQKNLNPYEVLLYIENKVKENFEDIGIQNLPSVLIYRPSPYSKDLKKDIVYMTQKDFRKDFESLECIEYLDISKTRIKNKDKYPDDFKKLVKIQSSKFVEYVANKKKTQENRN